MMNSNDKFLHWPQFDAGTGTYTHIVACSRTRRAAVIDPVLNYDASAARTSETSIDRVAQLLEEQALSLEWILETHAHADHLSGASVLKRRGGGRIAIGDGIRSVQATFAKLFDLPDLPTDGRQFDRLLRDGERIALGDLEIEVLATPGHTNDSLSYRIGNHVFIGDTLFRPDYGTARCDFPGGDAATLYASVQKLYALPDQVVLHFCHDYPAPGVAPTESATVAMQRTNNIHLSTGTTKEEFVALRGRRDEALPAPALIIPSLQVNIRAGEFPPAAANGTVYLKTPVNLLGRSQARSRA
jgi:glyoxylase-like metal-dependent hydrolase (beta-lactamase superfamily II)